MLIGTGGLAVGFLVSGLLLFAVLGVVLRSTVDNGARATAEEVARGHTAGDLPDPVPASGGQVVQIVDPQHRVLNASIGADRLVPMLRKDELASARAGKRMYVPGARVSADGEMRVVAVQAGSDTVLVAQPTADVTKGAHVLRIMLLIVYPLLVAFMAVLAWRVVGAALRPVDELRAGADSITGAGLTDRLPVPEASDEIHRLAVTLNGMLDRLAAVRARQRAFVADAAHELRSPIAAMRTELEVAQRHGVPEELVPDLLADVERLGRLVDDLLLLARADDAHAAAPLAREPVDLRHLLADAAERCRNARVPVKVVPGTDPLWTVGDRDALLRVAGNLVDNAVRHASATVTLAGLSVGGEAVLEVTDDGPGIPDADRERVFDRFTRLDDARARDAGGSGLGLAIVRELVRRHGGTVILEDAEPGVRAVVRLRRSI
ncbi:sensor histidine kinase [Virgisporangium aliadipatigenens]|uniref:sensor histidine kinase n=1 Tax=Virgisporangium aliadipatigenens TaxID=741659 RepID=UPI0019427748|nr:HAMP domain-containing sensor histidine kinase [Virgisporangium aliadipatigenens]